ncbi:hypothetical protein DPX16_11390 [Anabarilius grahami]|uniref:Uncharacterized protein n=1 Tax=Anabarilius grahami TaxID=495550 RepID=A0A3N0Y4Z3_ANAGA|nr:hypothetical protein DPX16_11390 [Anabarilius grahami]
MLAGRARTGPPPILCGLAAPHSRLLKTSGQSGPRPPPIRRPKLDPSPRFAAVAEYLLLLFRVSA